MFWFIDRIHMKSIKFSNDNILQLAKSNEALEQIPLLLKKRYGNQMADIWAFGVITGLRIVDKLNIRFENISGLRTYQAIN
ncbi:hypothetical protein AKH16_01460 [Vibrio parahaemolyticus]|nr:hypothetical protein AKH16_01460 [Vibrio parahaemolyticus]